MAPVTIDFKEKMVQCDGCGAYWAPPESISLETFMKMIEAWASDHTSCKAKKGSK